MEGLIIIGVLLYFALVGGMIACMVLYVKNLMDLMRQVEPKNRQIQPGFVWMLFIPFYGAFIFPFSLYPKIAESLKREFEERNNPQPGDYGKSLGLTLPFIMMGFIIPFLNFLAIIGWAVVGIIFWVKMAQYKKMLKTLPKASEGVRISSATDLLD
jgi:hypothetical protein